MQYVKILNRFILVLDVFLICVYDESINQDYITNVWWTDVHSHQHARQNASLWDSLEEVNVEFIVMVVLVAANALINHV